MVNFGSLSLRSFLQKIRIILLNAVLTPQKPLKNLVLKKLKNYKMRARKPMLASQNVYMFWKYLIKFSGRTEAIYNWCWSDAVWICLSENWKIGINSLEMLTLLETLVFFDRSRWLWKTDCAAGEISGIEKWGSIFGDIDGVNLKLIETSIFWQIKMTLPRM